MTNNEKWKDIQEILLRAQCTDDKEFKAVTLKHNEGVSAEAKALHEEAVVIDGSVSGLDNYNWMLAESGLTAFNLSVPDMYNPNAGAAARNLSNAYWATKRSPEQLKMVHSVAEIQDAKKNGMICAIPGTRQADFMLHRDLLGSAEVFSMTGFKVVRMVGETRSFIADNALDGTNAGLTEQGRVFLKALADHGVTIDLAYAAPQSFFEALTLLNRPVVCCGVSVQALYPHPANLSDEQIRAVANLGGVICLSANPELNWNGKDLPTIDKFVDAIAYIKDIAGIDAVGIGTGLYTQPGGQERHAALTILEGLSGKKYPAEYGSPYLAMYDAGWGIESTSMMGLNSVANLPNLTQHMLDRGFTSEEIKKVLGANMLRVFSDTWK